MSTRTHKPNIWRCILVLLLVIWGVGSSATSTLASMHATLPSWVGAGVGSASGVAAFRSSSRMNAPCTSITFAPITSYDLGSYPYAIAAGDFNEDGKHDLVLTTNSNDVAILLGYGNGSFEQPRFVPAGSFNSKLAIGDFNGDGHQDLAISNHIPNALSILLGHGNGSFEQPVSINVYWDPSSIAVGDFNEDGFQDLVVGGGNSSTLYILIGDGTGLFGPSTFTAYAINTPLSIVIGDFNVDGHQDLAMGTYSANILTILLGYGNASFGPPAYYVVDSPQSVAIGDFDENGDQDLAVANLDSNTLAILLGYGNGSFTQATYFPVAGSHSSVAIGDIDGDGHQDLVTTNGDDPMYTRRNLVAIVLGDGNGSFGIPTFWKSDSVYPSGLFAVAIKDFNQDGSLDLAVANHITSHASILLNTCSIY